MKVCTKEVLIFDKRPVRPVGVVNRSLVAEFKSVLKAGSVPLFKTRQITILECWVVRRNSYEAVGIKERSAEGAIDVVWIRYPAPPEISEVFPVTVVVGDLAPGIERVPYRTIGFMVIKITALKWSPAHRSVVRKPNPKAADDRPSSHAAQKIVIRKVTAVVVVVVVIRRFDIFRFINYVVFRTCVRNSHRDSDRKHREQIDTKKPDAVGARRAMMVWVHSFLLHKNG
ncbi:MAG TPA: hypothetical protein PLH57_07615 [Oligoflexia bacterium]|nr:hypothetical protein [Oligoflexia bacterium]